MQGTLVVGFAQARLPAAPEPANVTLTVLRSADLVGVATAVQWSIVAGAEAADVAALSGTVQFAAEATQAELVLHVLDDGVSELSEEFRVALSAPTAPGRTVQVHAPAATASVWVQANGPAYPSGVLGFAVVQQLTATEQGVSGFFALRVTREAGRAGFVSARYTVLGDTDSDFVTSSDIFFLNPDEEFIDLVLNVVDDAEPELDELFTVELSGAVQAPLDPQRSSVVVTILANDDPNGVLGLVAPPAAVREGDTVTVGVTRAAGLFGRVEAAWSIDLSAGSARVTDVAPLAGTVVLEAGQDTAAINVSVAQDVLTELAEDFVVRLGAVSGGARVNPAASSARVLIAASDDLVGFAQTAVTVDEATGTVHLAVVRTGDLDDELTLRFSTSAGTATPNVDYTPAGPTALVFAAGEHTRHISIPIINDPEPEEPETFMVGWEK